MIIIGISGKKQSGKTTVANLIKRWYGDSVAHVNFADALKQEVCDALKISLEELEKNKHVYRVLLQWYGTEYRRNLMGQDYWIKQWLHKVTQLNRNVHIVVCSDVRFPNEYNTILKHSGIVWRVSRANHDPTDLHPSECMLDDMTFDTRIENNNTMGDLEERIKTLTQQTIKQYNNKLTNK